MTAQRTRIGDLNRRLQLQAPVESADDEGGVTRTYETVTTLWAQVLPRGAAADIAAGSLGAGLRYTIVIRARDDITIRHQFIDGAHLYRVVAVGQSADRRFLEIEAEERQD
jgi:SPP1 family predicted phage head-tail adaptor